MWEYITIFWYENLKGRDHVEDLGVNERIILEWREGVDWIHLDEDRYQWRGFVSMVMNRRVL
jgi:hypothetical protein